MECRAIIRKMKTREKILQKTLELINANGPTALRIEDLSNSLKLSPGNITYYFPRKGDILRGVHEEYTKEAVALTEEISFEGASLQDHWAYHVKVCQLQWKYRGSLLFQMAQIHSDPEGRARDRAQLEYYYARFKNMVSEYKKSGLLGGVKAAESLRSRDVNFLVMSTWIIQYIPYASKENLEDTLNYYSYLGLKSLEPFLTEKGNKQYQSLKRKYGKRPF